MMFNYHNDRLMSDLCIDIHADNVKAGWWADPQTGESILLTRNKAEMLMLTVSELSEASLGFRNDMNDDHLPQYPMFHVELADTAIRLGDQIGAAHNQFKTDYVIAGCYSRGSIELYVMRTENVDGALMIIVNVLSDAMEHLRKKRFAQYQHRLWDALLVVFRYADLLGINLLEIMDAKRAYNKHREDHKMHNRKADGKQF